MLERFRDRAEAVREGGLPRGGEGRKVLIEKAERGYTDFSLVGAAA